MRHLILVLILAAAACAQVPVTEPGVSHELAKWRAAHYSDVRYKLNLTLEKMSPVLKGTMEIRMKLGGWGNGSSKSLALPKDKTWIAAGEGDDFIMLDWRKIRGSEKLSTISNVFVNGVAADEFEMNTNVLVLDEEPPKPAFTQYSDHLIIWNTSPGENVIKLDFTSPILTSGSAITRYVDKEDGAEYIYSLFVPSDASTAFPVFDQPDLKARFKLKLVYPGHMGDLDPGNWTAVSNTSGVEHFLLEEPISDTVNKFTGEKETEFPETKPISTYVFAFAAGPFSRFSYQSGDNAKNSDDTFLTRPKDPRSFSMDVYVRRSQAAKFKPHAAEVFRLNREGIKYLETYFDYKFPFPKYDIVLIPEFPFGGMEHAGATFLREASVIFPTEPTANDYISRANLIFHEAAHQWFGDTVTMKWFDDLWLKEGFAEFMAYKTLEKVMPEYNAWKVFYERNKQAAYLTDSTKGTTPIYQPIANLSAAKSAYGNIVYRKAPSFLKQAEFYIGPDKFQTAVRAFLKKHEFRNAGWEDLVKEFELSSGMNLKKWADRWVTKPGLPRIFVTRRDNEQGYLFEYGIHQEVPPDGLGWPVKFNVLKSYKDGKHEITQENPAISYSAVDPHPAHPFGFTAQPDDQALRLNFIFPNYQDYGYGIFLLDDKSRDYVLKNIHNEKDDFLRSMMWGSLWDSVREAELDPKDYVELVISALSTGSSALSTDFSRPPVGRKSVKGANKNVGSGGSSKRPPEGGTQSGATKSGATQSGATQSAGIQSEDESTIQTLLGRVSTALSYYIPDTQRADLEARFESMLLDRLQHAATPGQRITFFRFFVSNAVTERGRQALKQMIADSAPSRTTKPLLPLKTKDRFDIVTRLAVLGDPDAENLLAEVVKAETSDDAKRYAYAARAAFGTAENKAKFWNDFVNNKQISESWIEEATDSFNSIRHADLTLPYLERSLAELPTLKRDRKIFFVNGWLNAFIGSQRSEAALAVVNKFLADNPNLDRDLRLKVLENVDTIERAVKIRAKYSR